MGEMRTLFTAEVERDTPCPLPPPHQMNSKIMKLVVAAQCINCENNEYYSMNLESSFDDQLDSLAQDIDNTDSSSDSMTDMQSKVDMSVNV